MFEISRSEIDTIDMCPEKAYGTYREDSHGYVPSGAYQNVTTLQGIALHAGGQMIMDHGPDSPWQNAVELTLQSLPEPHRSIRNALIRRALLGWSVTRYPQLIAEWKPLGAEIPWKWEFAPGYAQPLRQDEILEHRHHGGLLIFDFKTAGSPDLNWSERKKISKQTHLYVKALMDASQRHVSGMMYDCIEIGKWDNKKELHKSPFVTGYEKNGKVQPKWAYGWKPVSLLGYSDAKWLEWAQATNAMEGLFWTTGIVSPAAHDLMRTQEATATQVQDWALKLHQVQNAVNPRAEANKVFPRNPHNCLTFGWEYACPFYARCWKGAKLDPETFEPRKDHHKVEVSI